jgi:hypothetical protein
MSEVEARAVQRIGIAMLALGMGTTNMFLSAQLEGERYGGDLAFMVSVFVGCLAYIGVTWALTRRVRGAWRGRADALASLARGPWAAIFIATAFVSLLELVFPAIEGLLAPLARGSSAWWMAFAALYCQLAVLWALLCTVGRVAWRQFARTRLRSPLWRSAAGDLIIAGLGSLLFVGKLPIDLDGLLFTPYTAWVVVAAGLLVLAAMLRDWLATRSRRRR